MNITENYQSQTGAQSLANNQNQADKLSSANDQSQTGDAARKLGDAELGTVVGGVNFYCNDQAPGVLENDSIEFDNVSFQNPWRDK